MLEHIHNVALRRRVATPAEAARHIAGGMAVAMGGYSMAGYPKTIARELVKRREAGEDLAINLVTGANVGQLDEILAGAGVITRRAPMCANKVLAGQINAGTVHYVEQQMNKMPLLLRRGAFGPIAVAVVEAMGITKEGGIIPTNSVGMANHLLAMADKVIVEINAAQPRELIGMHDVYTMETPPDRAPIPLTSVGQRIGVPHLEVDPGKIVAIVESNELDATAAPALATAATNRIAAHLFDFLEIERRVFWGGRLPPFQTGFGAMATSLALALKDSSFKGVQFFCGGIGDAVLELIAAGTVTAASTGGIEMSPGSIELLRNHTGAIHRACVIRSADVTNNAETIGRMGIIALNSGIEMDIYGNVNSSHIGGSKVVNGIGGGANFAQNAMLSVLLLPSTGKKGDISTIVPMVSHQDIGEHDIDIVITENGVADLRGLDDVERARTIIDKCASDMYKAQLGEYLERAVLKCGGHHPQLPEEAFGWHRRLKETGTMKM